ncbi:MAG TPA: hypothetical protein VKW76_03160 [Candidatus Binatia bacterium]|nr:hypothetical protein [Candidatus Binatia bacterium]
MTREVLRVGALLGATLAVCSTLVRAAPPALGPEETLRRYLAALKDGKADVVYELSSTAMRRGKDKEAWVKEQRALMAAAEVKILDFQVQPAKVEGEKAYVPDLLTAQDKFLNQLGVPEYELYTLVKEDGAWRIDSQTDVEPQDVPKWFPHARAAGGAQPSSEPRAH